MFYTTPDELPEYISDSSSSLNQKNIFSQIFSIIQEKSGIIINSVHENHIKTFVSKRTSELELSLENYLNMLLTDKEELLQLLDASTINESYFFREEQQFDYLKNQYFIENINKNMVIWSATCSHGEEPVSLYELAKECNINAKVYASDISTNALNKFKSGIFSENSFRKDGEKYDYLVKQHGKFLNSNFILNKNIISEINIFKHNILDDTSVPFSPNSIDIIFLRNTFIYFNQQLRNEILFNLSKYLKEGGLFFTSINEIASLETDSSIPLEKQNVDNIYFFKKVTKKNTGTHKKNTIDLYSIEQEMPEVSVEIKSEQILKQIIETSDITSVISNSNSTELITKNLQEYLPQDSNEIIEVTPENIFTIAETYYKKINKEGLKYAKSFLKNLNFKPQIQEYEYFLKGLTHFYSNELEMAKENYLKTVFLTKEFWPALVQLGLIYHLQKNYKEATNFFEKAKSEILNYVNSNKVCYNCLVESFSPQYFIDLCHSFINKDRGRTE